MLFSKAKRELRLLRAFQAVFLDAEGQLTQDGAAVMAFLRDEAGARGELGCGGVPYFYDTQNRFDANAAAFLLGKRRMFDLIVKYLALDEREVFRLSAADKPEEDELKIEMDV
ncbi:MAG: hypothetical protein NC218_11100 [Acetobacter sp.]|nr:hypothetical protein [Acetobacter sp.]